MDGDGTDGKMWKFCCGCEMKRMLGERRGITGENIIIMLYFFKVPIIYT
jgi:hypothetical protein